MLKTPIQKKEFNSREEASEFMQSGFFALCIINEDNSVYYQEFTNKEGVVLSMESYNNLSKIAEVKTEKREEIFSQLSDSDQKNITADLLMAVVDALPIEIRDNIDQVKLQRAIAAYSFVREVIARPLPEETNE